MKKHIIASSIALLGHVLFFTAGFSQNSILINFGSTICVEPNAPIFSVIKNPLTPSPVVLANCAMNAQLPDFFGVFVAYNPKDNRVYIADIRTGTSSRIWQLDVGLPGKIACPASIPLTPTYTHSYVSNNFEFDNNGDLWSLSGYNPNLGQCNMDKFDPTTGAVINTRSLQFPVGNFPTSITSGDIIILPNNRMFATLGSGPSRLYEILNYSSTNGNATAVYLQTLPKNCFGLAYLNGLLEVTGSDFSTGCYFYDYAIVTNTLGAEKPFQNGQAPIDNTSITPTVGTTKKLVSEVLVNSNTTDLTYDIYVRNMGNVVLNDINVTDDLIKTFGVGKVSNVSIAFLPGANAAGLSLNPLYNGTTVTTMLNPGQNLPNQRASNTDYFFSIRLQCRVTGIQPGVTYLNSAIGQAAINNDIDKIAISDSSNNGTLAVVDPNNDGNPSGAGENVPTPYRFGILPVHFLSVDATKPSASMVDLVWKVATPTNGGGSFTVEVSSNGTNFSPVASIPISNPLQANYKYRHQPVPSGNLYYRIKQTDADGAYVYSRTVLLQSESTREVILYPNPANQWVQVSIAANERNPATLDLIDVSGKILAHKIIATGTAAFNTSSFPNGIYLIKITSSYGVQTQKLRVIH